VSISFSPFSTPFNPAPINFIYTTPYDSSYGACYYDPNKLDVCLAWADQVSWSNELGYILSTYINPSSCSAGLASKQSPVSIDRFNYTNSLFVTGLTASTQYCFTLQGVKIQNFEEVISLPTYLSYTTPAIGPCIDITYGITQEVIVIVQSTTGSGKYNIYFKWVNGQTDYQQIEVKISCQVHVGNNNYRVFTYKKFLNSFTTSITDTIFIVGNIEVIVETITIRYFHVTYLDNCVVHRDQNYYKKSKQH